MKVKVLRQESPDTESHWETFDAEVSEETTIAGLLDYLNYHDDIQDETGKQTTRIGWECSCLQGVCGACAMVINGVPALACETMVRDLDGDEITIQPLRKFPVIHDLVVDRSAIQDSLQRTDMFIGQYLAPKETDPKRTEAEHAHHYAAAKCLKCGLCLEVCPNYVDGKSFYGALFANDCYLVAARNPEKQKAVKEYYGAHFGNTCSKAFSCMDVCPMNIPTLASMAKLNRS